MKKKIRVTLDLSQEAYDNLNCLAEKLGTSKSQVLRKSIVLLDVSVRAVEEGKKVGIAEDIGQGLTTEILML